MKMVKDKDLETIDAGTDTPQDPGGGGSDKRTQIVPGPPKDGGAGPGTGGGGGGGQGTVTVEQNPARDI